MPYGASAEEYKVELDTPLGNCRYCWTFSSGSGRHTVAHHLGAGPTSAKRLLEDRTSHTVEDSLYRLIAELKSQALSRTAVSVATVPSLQGDHLSEPLFHLTYQKLQHESSVTIGDASGLTPFAIQSRSRHILL